MIVVMMITVGVTAVHGGGLCTISDPQRFFSFDSLGEQFHGFLEVLPLLLCLGVAQLHQEFEVRQQLASADLHEVELGDRILCGGGTAQRAHQGQRQQALNESGH